VVVLRAPGRFESGLRVSCKEAEAEASKGKPRKKRITGATTPNIGDEEEEDIEENMFESRSDCIIVASSKSKSK
jgi:hypothetical protein